MKKLYSYHKFINEGVKDQMTPRPKEDIVADLKKLDPDKKILMGYMHELLWLIKLGLEEGGQFTGDSGYLLMDFAKINGREDIIELLKQRGVDPNVDMDIIRRSFPNRKVDESLRDKMTPKSKEDIDDEMEELEPLERVQAKLNQHINDIMNNVEPYFTQKEIDRLCEELVETLNYSHDSWDMVDSLYHYINLSEVIKTALKYNLSLLSAEDQIQCVHDMDHLGSLYTDKEWNELGVKAKKERGVNESLRDKMTPKSKEEIEIATRNLFFYHPLQFFIRFKKTYDDLKEMFTEEEIHNTMDKYSESLFLMMRKGGTDEEKQLIELKKIVWYLFKKNYIFDKYDSFNDLWFQHIKWTPYQGGSFSVNGYNRLQDAIDYVERMEKLNEGVRDKMTPKSDEEISNNLAGILSEVYKKSKELNWNIEINGSGINTYLILNFKGFRITVIRDHRDDSTYVNFTKRVNDLSLGYSIPDLSGTIENFDQLKRKIKNLLRIPILKESIRDQMTPKSPTDIRKAHYMIMFWKVIVDGKGRKEDRDKYFNDEEFIKQKSEQFDFLTPVKKDWQKELLYFLDTLYQFKNSQDEITRELVNITFRFDRNKEQAALYIAIKSTITRMYNEIDLKLKKNIGVGLLDESIK